MVPNQKPTDDRRQQVPALDRGLTILEMIADRPRGMTFGQIVATIGVPKVSVARLLLTLRDRGYIVKDELTGLYRPGPRMVAIGGSMPLVDRMREMGVPLIRQLTQQTGCTTLIFYFDVAQVQSVAKCVHPTSIAMQDVGRITGNLEGGPWGWLVYFEADRARQTELRQQMDKPGVFTRHARKRRAFYEQHHFTYDDGPTFPGVRRMAAPLHDVEGRLIGAMALGGNTLNIPNDKVATIGAALVEQANQLSALLGHHTAEMYEEVLQ